MELNTFSNEISISNNERIFCFNASQLSNKTKEIVTQYILSNFNVKVEIINNRKLLITSREEANKQDFMDLLSDLSIIEITKDELEEVE